MHAVLSPFRDFALGYINDILVFSKTQAEHLEHVRKVLRDCMMRASGAHEVKRRKCTLARDELRFEAGIPGSCTCCVT